MFDAVERDQRIIKTNDLSWVIQNHYKTNKIYTTKYSIFTFFPLSLFYQLIKSVNFYYVVIVIITSFRSISPIGNETSLYALIFVIAVSMIREAYEDLVKISRNVGEKMFTLIIKSLINFKMRISKMFLLNP